jgi:hypothetical protein
MRRRSGATCAVLLLGAVGCSDESATASPPPPPPAADVPRTGTELFVTGRFAHVDVSYQSDLAVERLELEATATELAIESSDGSRIDRAVLDHTGPIAYRLIAPARTGCDRKPALTLVNGTLSLALRREGPWREVEGCLELARALETTDVAFSALFDATLPDGRKVAVWLEIDRPARR